MKGANSVAEREGRVSHNAAACTVISACLFSFYFSWEGSLEIWEGLGANKGVGYEVCGAAARLEL